MRSRQFTDDSQGSPTGSATEHRRGADDQSDAVVESQRAATTLRAVAESVSARVHASQARLRLLEVTIQSAIDEGRPPSSEALYQLDKVRNAMDAITTELRLFENTQLLCVGESVTEDGLGLATGPRNGGFGDAERAE